MTTKKDRRILLDFLRARRSGVILTLRDWARLSDREKVLWLASKFMLEKIAAGEPDVVEPADSDLADDPELRRALERGAELVAEQAAS